MVFDDDSTNAVTQDPHTPLPQHVWTPERLHTASYKDLGSPDHVEDRFYRHLVSSSTSFQALKLLLEESSNTSRDYSISLDAFDLLNKDPILGNLLLRYPATLLPLLEKAVVRAQHELVQRLSQEDGKLDRTLAPHASVKGGNATRIHARLVNLPPYCFKPSMATIQAQDVGKIVQVTGTVVRTSSIQMYESARTYQCTGKQGCGGTFTVFADMELRENALQPPTSCPLALSGKRCANTKISPVEDGSVHTDYQEIKIQEAASRIRVGHMPGSLLIKLQHDLVDTCQPGDEVVVVGSLLAQWAQPQQLVDVECQVGMAMSAHSIRVVADQKGSSAWKSSGDTSVGELDQYRKEFISYWERTSSQQHPIAARDFICQSVCPKLYGLQIIKLALLLTLIGGVSSDAYENTKDEATDTKRPESPQPDQGPDQFQLSTDGVTEERADPVAYFGEHSAQHRARSRRNERQEHVKTRRRDQSHILLVGDPGTGKSQFLRFAAALCPRSVLTTGVGTTSAGLTCAAVREGNGKEFALEAGALVLADKGVCCIDEFGCIREQDRTTIHEAMEQQTLSVAKAGIVCKLNCRATVVAVMNPRDCLYDNQVSLSVNTGLGTPLLSRFDLIFKLIDTSDAERDSKVTTYLLNRAIEGTGFDVAPHDGQEKTQETPWSMDKLRSYIAVVKEQFQPSMSDGAALLLERHYERCRSANSNAIPVTVRFLESLIRLSQAHARLMFRNTVLVEDAVAVIRLMECSAFAYGGFDGGFGSMDDVMYLDPMTVDFSDEADDDFLCFANRIFQCYGGLDDIDIDFRRKAHDAASRCEAGTGHGGWSQVGVTTDVSGYSSGAPLQSVEPNVAWPSQDYSLDHYGRVQLSQPTKTKRRLSRD